MADTKISNLTAITALATADLIPVVDNSASETKKITFGNFEDTFDTPTIASNLTFTNSGAGTDPILESNNASQVLKLTGGLETTSSIELGNASDTTVARVSAGRISVEGSNVAMASDDLSFFSATTSAQLAGVISDETGSGSLVFGSSPSVSSPTVSGTLTYTNAGGGSDPTLASNDASQVLALTGQLSASAGVDINASQSYSVAGTAILSDSSGTMTLSNVDALDATTESTIESAIDTLANLTSVQGQTVTLNNSLTVEAGGAAVLNQDLTTDATPTFAGADLSSGVVTITSGATPTVNAAGEIAVDTDITAHTGLIKYHDGTEELTVIALPTGNLGIPSDGDVVSYNASNDEFEMSTPVSTSWMSLAATVFESSSRFQEEGTGDASVTFGISGLDLNAGSAQNSSKSMPLKTGFSGSESIALLSSLNTVSGTGSGDEMYHGYANGSMTVSDSSAGTNSTDHFGTKMVGDGTNIDWSATNSNGTNETTTEIFANQGADTSKVIRVEAVLGTSINWYEADSSSALATHTTNLPTMTAATTKLHTTATESTRIRAGSANISLGL